MLWAQDSRADRARLSLPLVRLAEGIRTVRLMY